jgi:hypothetical protein
VWVRVTDSSGNEATYHIDGTEKPYRELKLKDMIPPTIYLIGDDNISDFQRYRQTDDSGFGGGGHKVILADYNFADPGAYAEDGEANNPRNRGAFDITLGYPDLDGNGVGESHAIAAVDTYQEMLDCNTHEFGVIHVFNKMESISSFDVSSDSNVSVNDYDLHGTSGETVKKTNFRIYYSVKDGWGNVAYKHRDINIYESKPSGAVFYATPLNVSKYAIYDQNDSNNTSYFLTSLEKDFDGGGMSDFWEVSFGLDPNNPNDDGDYNRSDPATFKDNHSNFLSRWQTLPDFHELKTSGSEYKFQFSSP